MRRASSLHARGEDVDRTLLNLGVNGFTFRGSLEVTAPAVLSSSTIDRRHVHGGVVAGMSLRHPTKASFCFKRVGRRGIATAPDPSWMSEGEQCVVDLLPPARLLRAAELPPAAIADSGLSDLAVKDRVVARDILRANDSRDDQFA